MATKKRIVIGVDPGTRITGYGVIEVQDHTITALDFGCIRPPPDLKLSERYLIIHNGISKLLDTFGPEVLAMEAQHMDARKSVQSVLKLGGVFGLIVVCAKARGLAVYSYQPAQAKQAVVGNGRASKPQVQRMVQQLLNLREAPQPEDAADALAIALCHAHALRAVHQAKQEI